ncbi:MAG: hypothetical protein HGB10_05530 [Coriobacteriia bacterium]|nr:hypothetical protein [Coriobacteriia bacterium]
MAPKLSGKALWTTAATVAVLAVVIMGLAAFSPLLTPKKSDAPVIETGVTTPPVVPGMEGVGSGIATGSAAATSSAPGTSTGGSTTSAGNGSGSGGSGNGSGTGSNGTVDVDAFMKHYKDMAVLMPTTFPNFTFGPATQSTDDIAISGSPKFSGGPAARIIWSISDYRTAAKAKRSIGRTSKELFPEDARSVTVYSTPAYFGTDGMKFATVAFVRGRYKFEVLVTANGGKPKDLQSMAAQAAKAFPTSPAR